MDYIGRRLIGQYGYVRIFIGCKENTPFMDNQIEKMETVMIWVLGFGGLGSHLAQQENVIYVNNKGL